MNRRTVIKNLALVMGGAVLLPSCFNSNGKLSVHLKNLNIDAKQEEMVADICETIIPKTTTPGAKELNLHLFVLKMMDDCYKKKDQQIFMVGMNKFSDEVKKKYNSSFSDLDSKERESFLMLIENSSKVKLVKNQTSGSGLNPQKTDSSDPLIVFYQDVKKQTLFGYTNSQYFMTKQIVYELIPGRYNVHVPVKNKKTV